MDRYRAERATGNAVNGADAYSPPSEKFWSIYGKETEGIDKDLTDDWQGRTAGILIFAGLFSAIVTAFIIESYQTLSPDPQDSAVAALTRISQQLAALSNGSQFGDVIPPYAPEEFSASSTAVWVNALWFLSLSLSLTCALAATLVQQWARDYKQSVERHQSPRKRGPVRAHLYQGLHKFKMSGFMEAIPALLHVSLFLFLTGLSLFLYTINHRIGILLFVVIGVIFAPYVVTSFLPSFAYNYPFHTPFSKLFFLIPHLLHIRRLNTRELSKLRETAAFSNDTAIVEAYDFVIGSANEAHELEELLDSLPGLYQAERGRPVLPQLIRKLFESQGTRIVYFINSSKYLSNGHRTKRITRCLHAMWSAIAITRNANFTHLPVISVLRHWSQCTLELFDDPNPDISNPALAICALTQSQIQFRDPKRIPRSSYDDTLCALKLLRAFQLGPSQTHDEQQHHTTNLPFEAVIQCFSRGGRPPELWAEIYEHMITFRRDGMEMAFVNVVGVLLRRRRPQATQLQVQGEYRHLEMEAVRKLLGFCEFLTDMEAADVVRKVILGYLEDVPGDSVARGICDGLPPPSSLPSPRRGNGRGRRGREMRCMDLRGEMGEGSMLGSSSARSRSVSGANSAAYSGWAHSDHLRVDFPTPDLDYRGTEAVRGLPEGEGYEMAVVEYGSNDPSEPGSGGDERTRLLSS